MSEEVNKRNISAIAEEMRSQRAQIQELRGIVDSQNSKLASMSELVANLQKQVIMASVNIGSGPTVM